MKYLKIKNKGEIVAEAFMLIGASSKRGDNNKIGEFGSGNKYAISYFLRNNYEFKLFSGGKEIPIGTIDRKFNDINFKVITVDNHQTSITTEMGYKWKLWQAIREIYSNAKDEGLLEFEIVDKITPTDNTEIFISVSDSLQDFLMEKENYFVEDDSRVLFECPEGRILKKVSNKCNVYRKGIRCYDVSTNSIFDYDFNDISINESRIVEYSWQVIEKIWKLLYKCDNSYVIRKIFQDGYKEQFYESSLYNYSGTDSSFISNTWKELLRDKEIIGKSLSGYLDDEDIVKTIIFPNKVYEDLISIIGDDIKSKALKYTNKGVTYKIGNPTTLMLEMLKSVLSFFEECQFEINYPIDIVKFTDTDIQGCATQGKILISELAFSKGKEWIANIIIEEYIHLKHNVQDETRSFQDASISELLTYMKTINSYNL